MGLVARILHRLRLEARAAVQLYLLPMGLALVPTRVAMRAAWRLARHPWFYREEWTRALSEAEQAGAAASREVFAHEFRWFRLLDHVDCWLGLTRTDAWHRRRVDTRGSWPQSACVGVFFHVGPHAWAARSFRAEGKRAAVLAGRFNRRSMGGALLGHWYGWIRIKQLERDTGRPVIYAPGTLERSRAELATGNWVWGCPDVPTGDPGRAHPFAFENTTIQFPTGVAEIARRANAPIVVFVLAIRDNGRRELTISEPIPSGDVAAAMRRVTTLFTAAVEARPASFFLWPAMPALRQRG